MIGRATMITVSRCHVHNLRSGSSTTRATEQLLFLLPRAQNKYSGNIFLRYTYDASLQHHGMLSSTWRRIRTQPFSSSIASTSGPSFSNPTDGTTHQSNEKKTNNSDSNIFLDNLGKIFLSSIGLILLMLLRSTKSNNARNTLREDIESNALLDPLEIDELRLANSDFTLEVWEKIIQEIRDEFITISIPRTKVSYPEFLTVVMRAMRDARGEEGFTIQFGHLLDRVVLAELERVEKCSERVFDRKEEIGSDHPDAKEEDMKKKLLLLMRNVELPLSFLLAALSLALNSTVKDRVRALFGTMMLDKKDDEHKSNEEGQQLLSTVDAGHVSQMIQHLQNTCQLVPEAQIVETNSKVPYQTFRVGTGEELLVRARGGYGGKKGSVGVTETVDGPVTLEDFHAILKSRAVCAWGECYVKKSGRTSTSDL